MLGAVRRARAVFGLISDPRWRRRGVLLAIVGLLTTLPLVGSLGYEHAFVLSPVLSLLAMAGGVDGLRAQRGSDATRWDLARSVGTELVILHGLAIGMTLLGGLWQRGCDPLGGLAFYAMGPGVASLLGALCGLWGGAATRGRTTALLLAFAPMAFCIFVGLWRLYADPVVFAYDPFFGYFSGSVYDEGVRVSDRYLRYRGYNLLAGLGAAAAFALVVPPGPWVARITSLRGLRVDRRGLGAALTALLLGTAAFIGVRGSHYGFTADDASLREQLPLRRETEHFIIDYAPRTADARTIDLIAAEHEFAWHRLQQRMDGRAPAEKIHSFVFRDRDQKRAAMGAGTVQVAAPWRHQIYLDHRDFPHPVLHHELAHIFGNTIGDDVFGVARSGLRLNVGLIEGFATALAPRPSDRLDLHDQVEVLTALKRRPKLAAIMGPGFLSQSSRVAYTTAGSFCLWLIETRGFEPMAVLYRSAGDVQAAYGESLETLEAQWLEFLAARRGVRPEDVEAQAQRFKQGSLFERPCAHKVAAVRREIGRAAGRAQFDEAVEHHRELCALEPKQPAHKLGLAVGQVELRDLDGANATLDEVAQMPDLTVSVLSRMHELRGDVQLFAGALPRARAAYAEALALPGNEGHTRILQLKQAATADPELAPLITDYLSLFDVDSDGFTQGIARVAGAHRIRARPNYAALGSYLVARQLLNVQEAAAALPYLEQAHARLEQLPSDVFRRAARYALMNASLQTRDYARARDVLAELRRDPDIGNGHRLAYDDWRDRIDFFEQYLPAPPGSPTPATARE